MACHRYRAAVLDRNAECLRIAIGVAAQLVGKRGHEDGRRRAAFAASGTLCRVNFNVLVHIGTAREQAVATVLDIVCGKPGLVIEPGVTDHAVHGGMRACRERRMTDDRFGVGMRMVCIAIKHARVQQHTQAAVTETVVVAHRQIRAHLVDSDLQHQPGAFRSVNRECDQ